MVPRASARNCLSSKAGGSALNIWRKSEIGVYPNLPNHHLLYNKIDNMQLKNWSVNEVIKSSWSKK